MIQNSRLRSFGQTGNGVQDIKSELVAMKHVSRILLSFLLVTGPLMCWAQRPSSAVDNAAPAMRDVQFRSGDITLSVGHMLGTCRAQIMGCMRCR
jgi:hypothetical protein